MKPYYQDSAVTIYHGDCREVLPDLAADALITDPPYGISLPTNYRERKRGSLALCNDYPPIHGDDKPFDPTPFLDFRIIVLFGGNYFPQHLPPASGWFIWDKVDGLPSSREIGFNDQADAELIYTNATKVTRILKHRWMGAMKDSEKDQRRVHPTQKPVGLLHQIIQLTTISTDVILDPFMGSGTTLRAAKDLGRKAIGIEIEERYCEIAAKRMAQEVLDFGTNGTSESVAENEMRLWN